MRYRVLGPLEVETDNGPVTLGGQKERLLLALLLARPNQVVPVEALVEGLWGQVEQTARQTATSRSHLRLVQAKLAADVVDLQELGASQEQPSERDAELRF